VVGLAFDDSGLDPFWAVPVSLAVLAIGIGLAVARRQTRLGEGLILGWLISLTLVPLVLFGVCVAYLQNNQL
jgi:predicted permease